MNCPTCNSVVPDDARFCSNCGAKTDVATASDMRSRPAERKQITVLFSDLAGSTPLSERLDPEDLREVLRDYQQVCNAVVKRYDGYVAKFLGDGVLAYFGYPEAHEDDPRRGVAAGIAIVEAMRNHSTKYEKRLGVRTDVRVGIHTGLVVVGDMGSDLGLEADGIVGKTPNLAARVQGAAALNSVAISSDTHRLVHHFFDFDDLGDHELKGIAQPVRLYNALRERAAATRLEAMENLTPFTGRSSELGKLTKLWRKAEQRDGQLALVGGEAGVGKSRIVLAIKEHAAVQPGAWLTELRCSQYHMNSSFFPVIDFLERVVLQFQKDEAPQAKLEKLEGWLAQYGHDTATDVPLLAALLSIPLSAGHVALKLTPVKQKERTIELLVNILLKRSTAQPVLFVIEDLHWADPSTLELLDRLITVLPGHRMLVLLSHRPVFVPTWKEGGIVTRIELAGLQRSDAEAIIQRAAKGRKMPDEVIKHIVERTDGVPLFLEELTLMMIETDMLRTVGDRYELVAPLSKLPIPSTLQDSLAARLDRLKESKPVAQLAATIGREFTEGMIRSIPGPHSADLTKHLARMVDSGLVFAHEESAGTHYIFKHALIQDAAYNSLLKSSRKEFHKAIAGSFESGQAELVDAHPELIAHHYTQAEMPLPAMASWQKAGQMAISRAAMPEAISHLTKAVEQCAQLPDGVEKLGGELMAQTYLGLANMQRWGYGHPDVEKAFTRARDLCKVMGDPPQIFPVLHGLVKFRLVRGEYMVGLDLARQLQATAEASGNVDLLIEALYAVGAAHCWMGNAKESIPLLEKLQATYDPVAHVGHCLIYGEDPFVCAASHNHWQRAVCGDVAASLRDLGSAMRRVEELDHPWTTDYMHACRSQTALLLHDFANAERYAIDFRDSAIEHGFPWWVAAANVNLGWAMAHRGEVKEGLELAKQNAALWRMMGAELAAPSWLLRVTQIHLLDGDPDSALATIDEALAVVARTKEGLYEAELLRMKGEVLAVKGRDEEALALMNAAMRMAEERGENLWLMRAAASHVSLCKRRGRSSDALDTLKRARASITDSSVVGDMQHISELVA